MNVFADYPSLKADEAPVQKRRYRRLGPKRRRTEIVERSVQCFAQHGLSIGVRELADLIGISPSLLYHYFSSKDALIEAVYQHLFESRWQPRWTSMLSDPKITARNRIVNFYLEYSRIVLNDEWPRIFLFAALANKDLHIKNHDLVEEHIFPMIIAEIGTARDCPRCLADLTDLEYELAWNLHSAIFYLAIRDSIVKIKSRLSREQRICMAVDVYLYGAHRLMAQDTPESPSVDDIP